MAVQGTDERYAIAATQGVIARLREILADINLRLTRSEARDGVLDAAALEISNQGVRYIESVIAPRAAELETLLADYRQGVPANAVVEDADRLFLTEARTAAIKADVRGGVDAAGDTLAKLYALVLLRATSTDLSAAITAVKGTADAAHDTLGELGALVDAATAAAAANATAIGTKADAAATTAALGNRLRLDAAGGYSEALKAQGRLNLIGAPIPISQSGSFVVSDLGRPVRASGTITRTLPAASGLAALAATGLVENNGTGIVTVAAAGTDPLDGAAGGTLILWPKQSAWFYLDTDGWHTVWVSQRVLLDRRKLTTTTLNADFAIPGGFPKLTLEVTGALVATASANLLAQFSDDGAATFKTAVNAYVQHELVAQSSTVGAGVNSNSPGVLLAYNAVNDGDLFGDLKFSPGGGGRFPYYLSRFFVSVVNVGYGQRFEGGSCPAISINRATHVRLTTSGGGFTAQSVALYGEPG